METPVEIRYAGIVVAKAEQVRSTPVGKNGEGYFVAMSEPLPVGTVVALGEVEARVERVVEAAEAGAAGIYVRRLAAGEASEPWVPAAVAEAVPEPRHAQRPEPRRSPTIMVAAPPVEERAPEPARNGDPERGGAVMVAAVEKSSRTEEYRGRTIVVSAPEPGPPLGAAGEIDVRTPTIVVPASPTPSVAPTPSATIVVAAEPDEGPEETTPAPEERLSGERATADYSSVVGELPPARPLPPDGRRRSTRRRRNTNSGR